MDFNSRRHEFIGGSDVAALMGLSRWNTPLGVWAEKTKQVEQKDLSEVEAIEWGVKLEGVVADKFAEVTGKKVLVDETEYTHPEYPYMCAHIDRMTSDGEVLEVKTASAYKVKEWEADEIPEEYQLQLNWYLGIVGKEVGWLAVLIGGQKFLHKKMDFSHALFDKQVEMAKDFWEGYVLKGIPPLAVGGDKDTLTELFPDSIGEMQVLRGENPEIEEMFNQLVIDYTEGRDQVKSLERDVEETANKLRQIIKDTEGVETGQYIATWKAQKSRKLDIVRLKKDGLYESYATEKTIRVLRAHEKKASKA